MRSSFVSSLSLSVKTHTSMPLTFRNTVMNSLSSLEIPTELRVVVLSDRVEDTAVVVGAFVDVVVIIVFMGVSVNVVIVAMVKLADDVVAMVENVAAVCVGKGCAVVVAVPVTVVGTSVDDVVVVSAAVV